MTTGAADTGTDARDTFPKLLAERARSRPDRPAYREKEYGIWQTYDWTHVAGQVRLLAAGLADLGFKRSDRLIVVGDNRPRLYWSMCAAQSLGGVPVPVYQDSVADELAYVVEHAGARFALAENQEQVDKLLEIQKKVPSLGVVIYDDPRGLRHYENLVSYDAVQERGAQLLLATPDLVSAEVARAMRSRYAEDCLADAFQCGTRQYVILGAGLDTLGLTRLGGRFVSLDNYVSMAIF